MATRGTATDGHDFIDAAIEKGAKAIICEVQPSDKKDGITYIQVENSSDALGRMASAWYDFPLVETQACRSNGDKWQNHYRHPTLSAFPGTGI